MSLSALIGVVVLVVVGFFLFRKNRKQMPESHRLEATGAKGPESPEGSGVAGSGDPKAVLARYGISVEVSMIPDGAAPLGGRKPDTGEPCPTGDGRWLLNPKGTFPLATSGRRDDIFALKRLLDEACVRSWHEVLPRVTGLLCSSNIRCEQIDEFIAKSKPTYFETIEALKNLSSEWPKASDKDREDLLNEFRREAVERLRIRPNANLVVLFEGAPADVTLDDRLVERYGYDAVIFYLQHAENPRKARKVAADRYERPVWERLVDLGLAERGADIAVPALLGSLTLKEMAGLASDLEHPPFARKAKAIEYLSNVPDIQKRLADRIGIRQVFQLKWLPEDCCGTDLTELQKALAYSAEVAELLVHTYVMAHFAFQHNSGNAALQGSIDGWKILAVGGESSCPFCIEQSKRNFPATDPPVVPLHVGCRCSVSPQITGLS